MSNTTEILTTLSQRTIAFLEGRGTVPYYGGPINEETVSIIPSLVKINQLGLLTTSSQPGLPEHTITWQDGKHKAIQRSYLTGICSKNQADRLYRHINTTDKAVVVRALDYRHSYNLVDMAVTAGERWIVTRVDEQFLTSVGCWIDELQSWEQHLTSEQIVDIEKECCAIALLDPVWGRHADHEDGLFPHVIKALSP